MNESWQIVIVTCALVITIMLTISAFSACILYCCLMRRKNNNIDCNHNKTMEGDNCCRCCKCHCRDEGSCQNSEGDCSSSNTSKSCQKHQSRFSWINSREKKTSTSGGLEQPPDKISSRNQERDICEKMTEQYNSYCQTMKGIGDGTANLAGDGNKMVVAPISPSEVLRRLSGPATDGSLMVQNYLVHTDNDGVTFPSKEAGNVSKRTNFHAVEDERTALKKRGGVNQKETRNQSFKSHCSSTSGMRKQSIISASSGYISLASTSKVTMTGNRTIQSQTSVQSTENEDSEVDLPTLHYFLNWNSVEQEMSNGELEDGGFNNISDENLNPDEVQGFLKVSVQKVENFPKRVYFKPFSPLVYGCIMIKDPRQPSQDLSFQNGTMNEKKCFTKQTESGIKQEKHRQSEQSSTGNNTSIMTDPELNFKEDVIGAEFKTDVSKMNFAMTSSASDSFDSQDSSSSKSSMTPFPSSDLGNKDQRRRYIWRGQMRGGGGINEAVDWSPDAVDCSVNLKLHQLKDASLHLFIIDVDQIKKTMSVIGRSETDLYDIYVDIKRSLAESDVSLNNNIPQTVVELKQHEKVDPTSLETLVEGEENSIVAEKVVDRTVNNNTNANNDSRIVTHGTGETDQSNTVEELPNNTNDIDEDCGKLAKSFNELSTEVCNDEQITRDVGRQWSATSDVHLIPQQNEVKGHIHLEMILQNTANRVVIRLRKITNLKVDVQDIQTPQFSPTPSEFDVKDCVLIVKVYQISEKGKILKRCRTHHTKLIPQLNQDGDDKTNNGPMPRSPSQPQRKPSWFSRRFFSYVKSEDNNAVKNSGSGNGGAENMTPSTFDATIEDSLYFDAGVDISAGRMTRSHTAYLFNVVLYNIKIAAFNRLQTESVVSKSSTPNQSNDSSRRSSASPSVQSTRNNNVDQVPKENTQSRARSFIGAPPRQASMDADWDSGLATGLDDETLTDTNLPSPMLSVASLCLDGSDSQLFGPKSLYFIQGGTRVPIVRPLF